MNAQAMQRGTAVQPAKTQVNGLPGHQAAEHEFEAEPGLPEPLPKDERLLWQGAPNWRAIARRSLHTRTLAVYFAVLLGVRGGFALSSTGSWLDAGLSVLLLLPMAVLAIGVLSLMAWLIAKTSVYTITDKRVVMRIGVVLNITFNLPHRQIESASVHRHADGSGDIALALSGTDRIAYVHLWPHARPWHVKRTQPMLRGLPNVQQVAAVLSAALAESAGMPRVSVAPMAVAVAASGVADLSSVSNIANVSGISGVSPITAVPSRQVSLAA